MPKYLFYFPPSSLIWMRHLTYFLLSFWKQAVTLPKKWVHFLSLLTLFIVQWTMLSEQVHAQSLQWSQYTNSTNGSGNTIAVEKVPNGPIYVLIETRPLSSSTPVMYNTTNLVSYGSVLRSSSFSYSVLSKYSADGSTLEWVRLLTTSSTGNATPLDLALTPSNEPVVLLRPSAAAAELITPDAWQPNPPIFTGTGNSLLLAKFSASGALTYGTYIGPTGGPRNLASISPANTQSPQFLKIGADGTTYIAFSSGKSDDSQTGVIPTTAGAIMTANDPVRAGTSLISNEHLMIFKPDNTLAYSTYLPTSSSSLSGWDLEVAPNGDLYLGNSAQVTAQLLSAPTFQSFEPAGSILRFSKTGQLLGGTYIPNLTDGGWTSGSLAAISLRPNGNVVVATTLNSLIEFNPALDAVLNHFRPFGNGFGNAPTDIGIDAAGRVHYLSPASRPVITSGALQGTDATAGTNYAHYSIIDCSTNNVVYATNIGSGQIGRSTRLIDIEFEGNTAYLVGQTNLTSQGFPVTPTAYNSAGTATVSGYDISPSAFTVGGESVILAFNIPAFKTNTNTLTTPAVTTFCSGSGVLPIVGTKAEYITPNVIGKTSANPVPTPTHYQWQVATSNTGPWVDIPDSDVKDYKPEAPATSGQYFYRRLVRQTPFGKGFCVPAEDVTQTSNVVSLTFSNNKTHTTNIPDGKYGICKGGAALALSYTLTPSSDGSFAPYSYKLTSTANLATTVFGQSGTVAAAPGSINLNVGVAGEYILQVTDSRGCVSFDTLKIENLTLDAGAATKFTCGATSVKIGPVSLPPTYINYPTNNFSWLPATGLDNPLSVSPTFTHGLAVGDSTMKYLTFNGCVVDSIKIVNQSITPLPTLPDLSVCQGDTLRLGTGGPGTAPILVAQSGVTYQWAPGLGLTSNSVANPLVTTIFAPQGVNEITYTVLATAGNTGCAQTTTQKLTTYREPNQSFNLKQCMSNGCTPDSTLRYGVFGTDAEPGISYSWTATVVDDPANTGTTGLPTNAQALAFLSSTSASKVTLNSGTPGLGYASKYGYKIIYVRTSFNTANPTCMRTDTAELSYCCGSGPACLLALGNLPSISCGGPDNKIGPKNFSPGGLYYWSRLDGQPLNNELFEPGTNQPLSATGPHPFQVIANPSGTVPVDYRLTYIPNQIGADTCRVDIKVFPGAISKPNVTYPSPQSVCQGTPYTIQGPAQQPALTYLWSPISMLQSAADSSKALPTLKGLTSGSSLYVTVTDPTTGCATKDTVALVVTPVEVEAGSDASFCQAGATLDIGTLNAIQGYTYQWTASPSAGVTFGDATKPKTTVTLPTTPVGDKITLYLTATNGLTPANCVLTDSVIMTSAAAPTVTIPPSIALCTTTGGQVTIGPVSPSGSGTTYTWAGPGIVSGQGTNTITVNTIGTYEVTVGQGACTAIASRAINAATNPTVNLTPDAACATDVTIGATTMTTAQKAGWIFNWDKYDALKSNANDLSTITVRPTVETTYTLTATHASGCTQTFPVVVPAAAYTATLPEILNFCEGQAAVLPLNDPSSVSGTVVWTANPTSALAYLSNSTAVNPTIDVSLAPAGSYTYTATVSYPTGCISTASVRVNIGKKIENIAGIDREICAGSCTNLGVLPISGVSYEWSATPSDPTLTLTLVPRPLVCPTTSTTYKLKYTDAAGCQYTDDVFVKVNESPSLELTNLKICQNTSGTATANLATAIVTNTGTTTSYWANATATIAVPNTINYGGTFYVKTENASGCFIIKPVTVTFYDLPTATVTPSFDCAIQKGSLQIATTQTGLRFDYTVGSTYTGSKTFTTATALNSGTFITNLTAATIAGQDYTVRIFGSDSLCSVDYTVKVSNPCPVCTLTLTPAVSGCYQNNGSKATVSVEVAWQNFTVSPTANDASDSITVTFAGQTRTINPGAYTSSGGNGTIVSPQVVAFEVPADASSQTAQVFIGTDFVSATCKAEQTGIVLPPACPPTECSTGQTGGTIWNDFNADGIKQPGETAGVPGVTVKAYDCNGNEVGSTTTDVFGKYVFTSIPAGAYPIRVEFSNLPAYAGQGTMNGTDGRTTVQFVQTPDCTVDLGVLDNSDYCQANPKIIVPCYLNGDPQNAGSANDAAIVSVNYDLSGSKTMVAKIPEVSSVWGVAYNKYDKHLYSATVLRRHVGLLAEGLGGIFKTDLTTNTTTTLVDVETIGVNLGTIGDNASRGLNIAKDQPSFDAEAFGKIGKVGMGDMDISTDGQMLYFVNLFEKKLHRMNIASPTAAPGVTIPDPACGGGTYRPWGLKIYKGKAYVGVVCDGATSQNKSDLRAYVYQYDLATNVFDPTPVFDFPLTYPKGYVWGDYPDITGWYPWTDDATVSMSGKFNAFNPSSAVVIYPQPLLSDIEFDIDGSMVLGFLDRFGLQAGNENYTPTQNTSNGGMVGGDILRAYKSGNVFILENNAKAGPVTGSQPNNNQGPGFGEFYNDDFIVQGIFLVHSENGHGGVAIRPGSGQVVYSAMDPVNDVIDAGGFRILDNTTGQVSAAYVVYQGGRSSGLFAKAAGIGDVELGCDLPTYLEIGNRVWNDLNKNGVQDPCEKALSGVNVSLYKGTTKIAEAKTDVNGEYYFSTASKIGAGWIGTGADTTLLPNTAYKLVFGEGQLTGSKLTVAGLGQFELTVKDATANNGNDQNDSDVEVINGAFCITLTTGALASVNHTFDAGFVCTNPPIAATFTVVPASCNLTTENNDGKITLAAAVTPYDKFRTRQSSASWGADTSYATATALGATFPADLVTAIPNAGGTYVIRFYTGECCYKDTTIIVSPTGCTVGSLGDYVWKDTNNNGIQDEPASAGVANVQIELYKVGTATAIAKDTTDASGKYLFSNLDAGQYYIKVLAASLPAGCTISTMKDVTTGGGTEANDSDVDPTTGQSGNYEIDPLDPTKKDIVTVDAALYSPKGSLGDFVWKDTNNNGIQDETMSNGGGVAGVQIELYKVGTASAIAKDTTDASGKYLFSNLDAGQYYIKVLAASLPAGCTISTMKDVTTGGGTEANDSDVDPTTGQSGNYTIDPLDPTKKDILTVDAALVIPCVKSNVTLTAAPVCSADVQTYSLTFSVTNKVGTVKVDKGTLIGSNPYTVTGIPSGTTVKITDSLSAVCKWDTLITGPNCNCNPPTPTLITPSLTACIGDTFPTLKATVIGMADVEWFTQATGGTAVATGLTYKPTGNVTAAGAVFYAQARSTDPSCPSAISTSRVMATINAQNCTVEVDLALKKSINTKIAQIGDILTYTLKVWNESNTNATGVEVTDSIATTVQFQTGSFTASRGNAAINGNVIKWTIGNIASGGDTVTLTYQVKATQEGVHFNTAEISKTNEKDIDSTPGNGTDGEDDMDRQCFSVPVKLCPGEKVQATVPANLTNVQWFKDNGTTPVASGNTVMLTEVGSYRFTATNQTCPVDGCCPVIIEPGINCCPEDLCIPFTIKKRKK